MTTGSVRSGHYGRIRLEPGRKPTQVMSPLLPAELNPRRPVS